MNDAYSSSERRWLEEPDRACEDCLEQPQTAPDGLCDDCAADREAEREEGLRGDAR